MRAGTAALRGCLVLALLAAAGAEQGNAVAGGAGRALLFDWRRADVVSLLWKDIPTETVTFEAWAKVVDQHMTWTDLLSYSAYDASTGYESANELLFGWTQSYTRLFRATSRFDCTSQSCLLMTPYWTHQAFSWNGTEGSFGLYVNGSAVDLGFAFVGGEEGEAVDYELLWGSDLAFGTIADARVVTVLANASDLAGAYSSAVAEEEGPDAVVFVGEELGNVTATPEGALDVPALWLPSFSGGSLTLQRSRRQFMPGTDFQQPLHAGGVLVLTQEADKPWGDFDELQAFDGFVDELRVWDTVRTDEEIADNFALSVAGDEPGLHLYWRFDEAEGADTVKDETGNAAHDGLVGALPSIANEMTYATDRASQSPTAPLSYPSTAPVVSSGSPYVVAARAGTNTTIVLPAYDPDGDALEVVLVSVVGSGASVVPMGGGGVVVVVADEAFAGNLTLEYVVSDGVGNATGIVEVLLFEVVAPVNQSVAAKEDEMVFIVLGQPGLDGELYEVTIEALPAKGRLFQALFESGSDATYSSLVLDATSADLEPITEVGTAVANARGIVLFVADADDYGDGYASVAFRYTDRATGVQSASLGFAEIDVEPVNDPPSPQSGCGSDEGFMWLNSSDVDADSPDSFAPKTFVTVTSYPQYGELYQADGSLMDGTVERVATVVSAAAEVRRYSSQYSLCANCAAFKNPLCEYDLGVCTDTAWMSVGVLGEPDVYPTYKDSRESWDMARENYGAEWIELRFEYSVHPSGVDVYETYQPGAVVAIKATSSYVDDTSAYCDDTGVENDEPVPCSVDSEWTTLWTGSDADEELQDEARVFSPPLCPSVEPTDTLRLELDTSAAPGWNSFDAVKLSGSLEPPPGLVSDWDNRVSFVPATGVHGEAFDSFEFTASDCLSSSTTVGVVTLSVAAPEEPCVELPYSFAVEAVDAGASAQVEVELPFAAVANVSLFGVSPPSLGCELEWDDEALTATVTPTLDALTNVAELWLTLANSSMVVRSWIVLCRPGFAYVEALVACVPCSAIEAGDAGALSADDSARFVSMCSQPQDVLAPTLLGYPPALSGRFEAEFVFSTDQFVGSGFPVEFEWRLDDGDWAGDGVVALSDTTAAVNVSVAEAGTHTFDVWVAGGTPESFSWDVEDCAPSGEIKTLGPGGELLCAPCPAGADCLLGEAVSQAGFWFSSPSGEVEPDTVLYECPIENVCLAGGACAEGYDGVVCAVCADGYALAFGRCAECPESRGASVVLVIFVVLLALAALCALLKFSRVIVQGSSFKIILNFSHTLSAVLLFEANWPPLLLDIVGVLGLVNVDFSQVSGAGCTAMPTSFYARWLTAILVPSLIVAGIWARMRLLYKPRSSSVRNTMLVLLMFYPGVSGSLIQFFNCREIEGLWHLKADYSRECFDATWYQWLAVAAVLTPLFVVGVPVEMWRQLRQGRASYMEKDTLLGLGLLYKSYRPACFYHEIYVLLYKLCLWTAAVLMADGVIMQTTFALVLSTGMLVHHALTWPFLVAERNVLQLLNYLVTICACLSGLILRLTSERPEQAETDAVVAALETVFVAQLVVLTLGSTALRFGFTVLTQSHEAKEMQQAVEMVAVTTVNPLRSLSVGRRERGHVLTSFKEEEL